MGKLATPSGVHCGGGKELHLPAQGPAAPFRLATPVLRPGPRWRPCLAPGEEDQGRSNTCVLPTGRQSPSGASLHPPSLARVARVPARRALSACAGTARASAPGALLGSGSAQREPAREPPGGVTAREGIESAFLRAGPPGPGSRAVAEPRRSSFHPWAGGGRAQEASRRGASRVRGPRAGPSRLRARAERASQLRSRGAGQRDPPTPSRLWRLRPISVAWSNDDVCVSVSVCTSDSWFPTQMKLKKCFLKSWSFY